MWEDLLGIAKCAEVKEVTPCVYAWVAEERSRSHQVFTLMDHVAHYRPAAQHLLERLFRLHDLTEDLFARWPENGDPFKCVSQYLLITCNFADIVFKQQRGADASHVTVLSLFGRS